MPRKPRKTRSIIRRGQDIQSWVRYRTTVLRYVQCIKSPWTDEEALSFWTANRGEIMREYLDTMRKKGQPFQRPQEYFDELEAKHPRRRTGWDEWYEPQTAAGPGKLRKDPVFETNEEYLRRLGLLESWEIDNE